MSDLLTIAASGVNAYQSALTTVSENISNAGTAGYVRRAVNLTEVSSSGGSINGLTSSVSGVRYDGVDRQANEFRSEEVRTTSSDLSRSSSGVTWLQRIDSALNDNGLSDQLTGFFNSVQAVAADPTATAPRASMLEAAKSVASAFTITGKALDTATSDMKASVTQSVNQLNQLSTTLATVNDALGRSKAGSSGQAALMDQRDQVLDQMSQLVNINVSTDSTGRATVRAGGASGPLLVEGNIAGTVVAAHNNTGVLSFSVHRNGQTSTMTPGGGSLAGMVDSAQKIADASTALQGMATDFMNGVNSVQAGGQDLSGNAGQPIFAAGSGTAALSVVMDDPQAIAAAATGGGTRDNSNIQEFNALRSSGGFEQNLTNMIADNGSTLSGRQQVVDAQTSIRDQAVSSRDSLSGVNLDEEAVDLMRFQQAYQASSRVIQVARETFQSLINIG